MTREYYINDAGAQIEALAQSGFLRYREALGEDIGAIPEGLYPGDYLKQVGEELKADYGDELLQKPESEWMPIVRERAIDIMMAEIRNDLWSLDVVPDVFFSEALADRGRRPGREHRSSFCASRATSSKAACRRRRARRSTTTRIASRPCSAPPRSATMSTAR